ncbi:AMP-binding protein [Alphaproteobacteria bacterium]|nr:AMP-binding protein [Alphaproteobacteria bacterium]
MKTVNESFYNLNEIQPAQERENLLFKDINKKLDFICNNSEGWKQILSNCDISQIKSRTDLKSLPITRKSNLTAIQNKSLPYGELTTKKYLDFPYMFASPGPIYEPGDNGDFWNMASSLYAAGLREGKKVYNTFSYHLGPAGIMLGNAASQLGCPVIPGGIGNTDLQVETIRKLKPSFYIGTPSFLKIIMEKIRNNNISIPSIKNALVGAEAFPKELRNYLNNSFGICPLQMYGTAEVGCIAYETKDKKDKVNKGMIVEENIILEIVRPGSLKPAVNGEVGEVIITKLNSNYPMLRLATGDLSAIIEEPSPCGRTNTRIVGWMGRAEQSTKVKGLFITPNQLTKITEVFKELFKVRLIIDRKEMVDIATLQCESNVKDHQLEEKIKEFFKSEFKLNTQIQIIEKNKIPNDGIVIEDKRSNN